MVLSYLVLFFTLLSSHSLILLSLHLRRDVGETSNEFMGDFCKDCIVFGCDNFDKETKLVKFTIELNNSRAVMLCLLGLMVYEEIPPPHLRP